MTQNPQQIAKFEITVSAIDKPTDRARVASGGLMASREASEALNKIVDSTQNELRALGFEIVHTSYGVSARGVNS